MQPAALYNQQGTLFTNHDGNYVKFCVFHSQHPKVYMLFEKFAFELINRGHTRLGAKMIIERIRWEYSTGSKDDAGFKINNNYTCYYSRLFVRNHPKYATYFEMREVKN